MSKSSLEEVCYNRRKKDEQDYLIKDTKKRTAQRHELNDNPWVWLAAPLLLLALLVVGWVRSVVGI